MIAAAIEGPLLYLLGGGAITALGSLALQAYRARTGKEGDQASTAQVLTSAATAMVLPLSARITVLEAQVVAGRVREERCQADLAKVEKRMVRLEAEVAGRRAGDAKGDQGEQGETGKQGATGATGRQGETGEKGEHG